MDFAVSRDFDATKKKNIRLFTTPDFIMAYVINENKRNF